MTHSINQKTQQCLSHATDLNLSHSNKIERVGECKISLCYNVVPAESQHLNAIRAYPNWKDNKAFTDVDELRYFPQFKSRMHEAAMAKTLNLVYRDPWGVTEDYYTPDEDFVYFDSNDELEDKINYILNNWKDFEGMVESAYNKSLNYTTDRMFDIIKQGKSWKPKSADPADQKN